MGLVGVEGGGRWGMGGDGQRGAIVQKEKDSRFFRIFRGWLWFSAILHG